PLVSARDPDDEVNLSQPPGSKSTEPFASRSVPAFEAWRTSSRFTRRALIQRWRVIITEQSDALARLATQETGKPIALSRGELSRGTITLQATEDALAAFGEESIPYDIMAGSQGCLARLQRLPRGPVLAITPFNFPVNLALHKLAPAIAAGCSAIWKPCPQAPLTSRLLFDTFETARAELGAPEHLLQLADVPPEAAEALALDARIGVVSFTGSDRVGLRLKKILEGKPLVLELGGNAAVVLDEGIDAVKAAQALAPAAVAAAGQSCCKAQRFYVHGALWEAFAPAFIEAVEALPCGDPTDEATVVGPLIDEATAARLDASLDRAIQNGATVLLRGRRKGALLPPAILTDVPESDPLQCDELFGPIAVLTKVADFDDGLSRAAATRFGLRASVYTRDSSHERLAEEKLHAGCVLFNLPPTFRMDAAPFGGLKASGQGLEGPRWAMEAFTEPRMIVRGPVV
ncbi:MAG: aldehyde dehydrogenase family protein, partial [Acidobacteriota bacterium]|nr:aldehyde dehydrogenase family protein [Acidobacteriota bacterium]